MNRKKKQTRKTPFFLLMGISLSLMFLFSGAEAAPADNNLYQPLSFSSIINPHSLIDVDGMAFMLGTSTKTTTDKKTSTDTKTDTKTKSGKKLLSDQKNSTARRRVNIDD